ncbi:hypothetical protein FKV24_013675 [Lysobacter maris]|uniref:Uncharacterized protein n=1 Tax=Marilutibacter maris TaxID=1605891 RepID=A0A508AG72_9GAMM|nr:hypothetical protein [Lysobacter maris]KAB8174837.1 hypothetical protein FKV24_013675 [Lysobacter maris]
MKYKHARPVVAPLFALVGIIASGIPQANAADPERPSRRYQLVHEIVMKWAPVIAETHRVPPRAWARGMGGVFADSDLDALQAAVDARSLDGMIRALVPASGNGTAIGGVSALAGTLSAQNPASVGAELVYVPVTPCRIFDTRVTGEILTSGSTRDFDVTGVSSYGLQGGDAGDCNGVGAVGAFAAAAISLSVATPARRGFITAYPFGTTRPQAATMVYNRGVRDTTLSIVALDQDASAADMSIYSASDTHVVGDIVGYFIKPRPIALECIETGQTVEVADPGVARNAIAPACATGFTQTATNCQSSSWQMPFVYMSNGICSAQNNGESAANLRASRTCCRVPGG